MHRTSPCHARAGSASRSSPFAAMLGLPGCGYNEFQTLDEQVTAAWSEVLSQYQRRADLIPNIVATVKGEANFEQETLTKVIEARAKATADPGDAGARQRSGGVRQVPGRAGRAERRAEPAARRHRELSEPEGQRGVPGPARPARRHREPHHRRAQQVHRRGPAVQRQGAQRADQLHGDDLRLQDQAELHGRQRSADLDAAGGELRQARVALRLVTRATRCARPRRGGRCSARSPSARRWPKTSCRCRSSPAASSTRRRPSRRRRPTRSAPSWRAIEKERGAQIVVLIVPTARPEDIASFAQRVASSWKLGTQGSRRRPAADGRQERPRRQHPGRGDAAGRDPRRRRRPHHPRADRAGVQGGDFAGGLNLAVDRLGALIAGEKLPAPRAEARDPAAPSRVGFDWQDLAIFLFVGVPIVGRILSSVMGRKLGALAHRRRGRRDRLVADGEPARRRRRRHRRALSRRRDGQSAARAAASAGR